MDEMTIIFSAFLNGMGIVFTVPVFSAMMIGIVAGMIVGLIPGLGGLVAHILLIPFALQLGDPLAAIAMLLGVYAVTSQTDSIPAVMLGVPGTAAALATSLDGYPMAKRGEAGRALSASYFASIFGTLVATVIFILFLPLLRALVTKFSSPEFFMMVVLGLVMAASLSGRSQARGLLMAGLGLILSTVGQAPGTGDPRFIGPFLYLWEGVPIIPVLLGLFGVPEIIDLAARNRSIATSAPVKKVSGLWLGMVDCVKDWWLILRCSVIGVVTGFIPGLGGTVAEWMCYANAVASDKDKDSFGKGNVRGIIAPETGTAAHLPGAVIPTVAFGVPGNPPMAVLLGVFVILGVRPGQEMLTYKLDETFMMVNVITVGNIIAAALCLVFQKYLVKLCYVRASLMVPFILAAMVIGAGFSRLSLGDIAFFAGAGIAGYVFKHLDWPRVPLVMGLILGGIAEPYFFASIDRYGISWLYARPIVLVLEVMIIFMLFSTPIKAFAARLWKSGVRSEGSKHGDNT
ncbi:MAG: tripartite tricarboxylate transporter permease [Alphaproteobacteria bacterium]|nr:tripartite tricarboxylate transporter permease [Alphaproteobacteria bacterium]